MDNFDEAQSKYGKIYKVAGPRKWLPNLLSGCGRKHVWF